LQLAAADREAETGRYAALEEHLRQEASLRTTLEDRVAAAEIAGRNAAEHHASELAASTARIADLQGQYVALTGQLRQREMEFGVSLAEALAAREAVESRLKEVEAAHAAAEQRFAAELERGAERHSAIQRDLTGALEARTALEGSLTAAMAARQEADHQHATELATLTARLQSLQAEHVTRPPTSSRHGASGRRRSRRQQRSGRSVRQHWAHRWPRRSRPALRSRPD
jgi:hypothetical protein